MAKRKPTITIEDFNDGWADAYAKLLRNRRFQQASTRKAWKTAWKPCGSSTSSCKAS